MTLYTCAHDCVSVPSSLLLDPEGIAPCRHSVRPMSILTSGPETWPWVLWAGGDPCITECLECSLARPVLAQIWSQTATDGAWYPTTALLSSRDRSQCLCVLRLRGFEPKPRRTGSVATSLSSISLLVARAGNVEIDRYPQLMMPGAEKR